MKVCAYIIGIQFCARYRSAFSRTIQSFEISLLYYFMYILLLFVLYCIVLYKPLNYNAAVCISSRRIYRTRFKFTFLQAHSDARAVSYSFEIEIVVIFTFGSLIARVICFATK